MEENNNMSDKIFKKRVITCVIGACIVIAFYFCLNSFDSIAEGFANGFKIFQPFVIGLVMAFLMNPIMEFIEQYIVILFKKISKKEESVKVTARTVSSILSLLVLVGIIVVCIVSIVPQVKETIQYLSKNIGYQIDSIIDWCNSVTQYKFEDNLIAIKNSDFEEVFDYSVKLLDEFIVYDNNEMLSMVTTSVVGFIKSFVNVIIGMFVSVYVLNGKEKFKGQIKKLLYGILKPNYANITLEVSRKAGDIFYGFIIGKIVDSIIIGIICYIGCLIMRMPYAVLVSVIVGVTNIIPVFGPYIGAIPTVLIIFLTSPIQGLYFLIFVLVLQQFDGNFLGPKILGNSTGISSFWVLFGVVVGAGILGVPGMIIGVPLTAIVYYILQRVSKYLLRRKDLPEETNDYVRLERIDIETNQIKILPEKVKEKKNSTKKFKNPFKKKEK